MISVDDEQRHRAAWFWERRFQRGGVFGVLGKAHWRKSWYLKRQSEDELFLTQLFAELSVDSQDGVLDFGCGAGRLTSFLLEWTERELYCVDVSPTALSLLRRDFSDERVVPVLWPDGRQLVGRFSLFFSCAGLCYEHDDELIRLFLQERMTPYLAVIIEARTSPKKRKDGSKLRSLMELDRFFGGLGMDLAVVRRLPYGVKDQLTAVVFTGGGDE